VSERESLYLSESAVTQNKSLTGAEVLGAKSRTTAGVSNNGKSMAFC